MFPNALYSNIFIQYLFCPELLSFHYYPELLSFHCYPKPLFLYHYPKPLSLHHFLNCYCCTAILNCYPCTTILNHYPWTAVLNPLYLHSISSSFMDHLGELIWSGEVKQSVYVSELVQTLTIQLFIYRNLLFYRVNWRNGLILVRSGSE